jgi:linoleoyl-CoA desaturase
MLTLARQIDPASLYSPIKQGSVQNTPTKTFSTMQKTSFDNSQSFFFNALKEKVNAYFAEAGVHPFGSWKLYLKSIIQVLSAVILYVILVFFTPPLWISLLLCFLLGINLALIGFNVMHEGGHQSFSRHKWVNVTASYFLNVLGGNSYFWKIKHNINHHTFTNIEGLDSDIDVKPFMRLHDHQPRYWFHRFQHVYWIVLYGISYVVWIFYEDFLKYFSGKISANSEPQRLPLKEHIVFWTTKILYVVMYLVLPIIMVGWVETLVGFLIITFVCGLFISIVFQLAHVVESTAFPVPDMETQKIRKEWAIHQITTTANFATSSKLLHWLLGGLNFQIEHHLFPKISHVHYPNVSRLVKEVCQEYNIAYLEYSSMFKAILSHILHLRALGRP